MTTLARDADRVIELGGVQEYPVIAADIIYGGGAVGDDGNGYCRPLVAGDAFRGFAERRADNALGAAGAQRVRCRTWGETQLSISGLAITDVGKDVYASDDNAFTLTESINTRIGSVARYVSSGIGIVSFEANRGDVAELTENSAAIGGTNDGNLPDLTATAPAVTDSTGGTPDTSGPIALEAVTTPTAVVDLTTGAPDTAGQRDLEAVSNPNLASWDGATVFPSAAQATAINAAITALKNNQATQSDQNDAIVAALVAMKNNQATQSDAYDALLVDLVALRAAVREVAAAVNSLARGQGG